MKKVTFLNFCRKWGE